jgi:endonuclease/exonuclease/phosphatase (EEP) superfamily protein YafD
MALTRLRFAPAPRRLLAAAAWWGCVLYFAGLVCWFLVQRFVGDSNAWLFVINAASVYFFAPLPLALAIAVWRRSLPLSGGSLVAVALFAWLWGGLFWPNAHEKPEGSVLTVMTYNVLGFNTHPDGVIDALRKSDADIIGLSELNKPVAAAISRELRDEYPYQTLDPRDGVTGSGVISRLPFLRLPSPELADPGWISPPTVLQLSFDGEEILFVRVHSASGAPHYEARERQARLLADYAAAQEQPVILAGDFNTTDRNDSYEILTAHLYDAWEKAGSGLGNTFPGASKQDTPGSSRPDVLGIDAPQWLIRIDYVFCTYDWEAVDARIGPWDGHSDHRPVIAEVALRQHEYAGP